MEDSKLPKAAIRTSRVIRRHPTVLHALRSQRLYRTVTPDRTSDLIFYDAIATEADFASAQFE